MLWHQTPGTRIHLRDPRGEGELFMGTVLGWPDPLAADFPDERDINNLVPICSDLRGQDVPGRMSAIDGWVGEGHGYLIERNLIGPSTGGYDKVPTHIGVYLRDAYRVSVGARGRMVELPPGISGRVLTRTGKGEAHHSYAVAWCAQQVETAARDNRYIYEVMRPARIPTAGGRVSRQYKFVTRVPISYLQWCFYDDLNGQVWRAWPRCSLAPATLKPKLSVGQFVIYTGKALVYTSDNLHRYTLMSGDIAQIINLSSGSDAYVNLPSWSGERYSPSAAFHLSKKSIAPLEHQVIPPGQAVEVVATVTIRGRELKGKKGKVVLPIDTDGDIGIEFSEDVRGAGSLDGKGRDGRCLYVPADSVKEVVAE